MLKFWLGKLARDTKKSKFSVQESHSFVRHTLSNHTGCSSPREIGRHHERTETFRWRVWCCRRCLGWRKEGAECCSGYRQQQLGDADASSSSGGQNHHYNINGGLHHYRRAPPPDQQLHMNKIKSKHAQLYYQTIIWSFPWIKKIEAWKYKWSS
jgi:hypothetical protein